MSEVTETLSNATDELLARLQASPTDLRKLVGAVLRRDCQVVGVSGAAIARWGREDLENWTSVLEWLTSRGIRVVVAGAPRHLGGGSLPGVV